MLFLNFINKWGFDDGNGTVHGRFGKIQTKRSSLGPCIVVPKDSYIYIYHLFYHRLTKIDLVLCPTSCKVFHEIGDVVKSIPYVNGTPFTVTVGDIVVKRRSRGRFGVVYVEVARGKSWPMTLT